MAGKPADRGVGGHRVGVDGRVHFAARVVTVGNDRRIARGSTGRAGQLATALGELRDALTSVAEPCGHADERHREQVHDARTVALALAGASRLLSQSHQLAPADVDRLWKMVIAELDRLQSLLADAPSEPIRAFNLAEVLEPVLLAHHLSGTPLQAQIAPMRVIGRPRATATAVANLLANARAHAPGATVTVRAATHGEVVAIAVEDDGPGIAAQDRDRVLLSGQRASAAPGTGIGLHSAATAMSDQAGSLQITERPGGGTCVILTLPEAC